MSSSKIIRKLPKKWNNQRKVLSERTHAEDDFAQYCRNLYTSLLGIKEFYEDDFNKNNICTIDEYISYFNSRYEKFVNLSINNEIQVAEWYTICNNRKIDVDKTGRFKVFEYVDARNPEIYKLTRSKDVIGFTDHGFKTINSIAKDMFLIEKLCSFTTRKYWENEITKLEDLDLNGKFKILVKCVFPGSWRSDEVNNEIKKYHQNRIYSSTSLIDEEHKHNLFTTRGAGKFTMLIMEYTDNNFVCANRCDDYSEESIDDKNPLEYKQEFTSILVQDKTTHNGRKHKLFAYAVECETPKNILKHTKEYSEVNLKNAKVVGVIAPNKESLNYSQKQADKYKVPMFTLD
ncbi:MAG TPA: hypothetical protein DCO89_01135 [Clostridiales bacterium]|nr:hypothetical protein [Clostridiales bacterium]